MYRRLTTPILVHIVTHLLDKFRDQVGPRRLVCALADSNVSRSEVASVLTDPVECDTVQTENRRNAKPKWSPSFEPMGDLLLYRIELAKSVFSLFAGTLFLIRYKVCRVRDAMSDPIWIVRHFAISRPLLYVGRRRPRPPCDA